MIKRDIKPICFNLNRARGDFVINSKKLIITRSITSKSIKNSKKTLPILIDLADNYSVSKFVRDTRRTEATIQILIRIKGNLYQIIVRDTSQTDATLQLTNDN